MPRVQAFTGAVTGDIGGKSMNHRQNGNLKQRVIAWLHPEQIEKMELLMQADEMKNHTEFVSKAVDFYMGYRFTTGNTAYLSEHLLGAIEGSLKNTEKRMANNLFRLSVEMSMMMNILAAGLNVTDDKLAKMRSRCTREVKANNGKIAFEDAVSYQRDDTWQG